jgi:hypothetical protein
MLLPSTIRQKSFCDNDRVEYATMIHSGAEKDAHEDTHVAGPQGAPVCSGIQHAYTTYHIDIHYLRDTESLSVEQSNGLISHMLLKGTKKVPVHGGLYPGRYRRAFCVQ